MATIEELKRLDKMLGSFPNLAKAVGSMPNRAELVGKDLRAGSASLEQSLSVSTSKVIEQFLAHKRAANLTEASIRSYGDTLRQFARAYPTLPTKPEPIEEYLSKHRGENSTAKNIYIVLSLLYKFANARLGLPNPMTQIDKPTSKPKAPQPLTANEAQALLDAIEGDREQGLIYCLFCLGLRLKETRYLRVADIGEDTIQICGKERNEPLPLIPEIRDVLLKLTDGKRPEDYIFNGQNGQPLSDSMIQLIIKQLFAKAKIDGVRASPHTLRHSRGAITAAAGLDTASSSRLLRHADISQTNRYSQLNLNQLRAKEERFNPLRILGKKPDYTQG